MIRNVVVGEVREGVDPMQVEEALQALRDLVVDGITFTLVAGQDLGLRAGNAAYAITADFATDDDYRVYDLDAEHNRIRTELFVPLSTTIRRIQFRLPD